MKTIGLQDVLGSNLGENRGKKFYYIKNRDENKRVKDVLGSNLG